MGEPFPGSFVLQDMEETAMRSATGTGWKHRDQAGLQADAAATVRRVISNLNHLEPETARYLAGLAFILTRVADADERILPDETRRIEAILNQYTSLNEDQAVLMTEIARHQVDMADSADAYQVSRELRAATSQEQRRSMLCSLFTVALADGNLSAVERTAITQIASELGFHREEVELTQSQLAPGHA